MNIHEKTINQTLCKCHICIMFKGSRVKQLSSHIQLLCLFLGDRVAIEPGVPCRMCRLCKSGNYNLCKDIEFCATPPINGSICRLYKHAADFCFRYYTHIFTISFLTHSKKMFKTIEYVYPSFTLSDLKFYLFRFKTFTSTI